MRIIVFQQTLANSLQASFNKQNITVEIVPTNHNQTDKEVADLLLVKNGNKKMMFHIHQLHTDGYGVQFLYYTIDVKIFDQNKQLLKQKTFTGKDKLGGDAFGEQENSTNTCHKQLKKFLMKY